ncbi:MAG: hypothetical protein DRR08_20465 [Candidatus Parabeggiatoa sp. nov. 2]|nr:MAG: hypothetical protein B6247_13860 [Beggiatoa sp. 4572_84]RKZ56892.1 MAG: hypothetical protein DRR08_20465 [Gammaproteobacteria bacterium]
MESKASALAMESNACRFGDGVQSMESKPLGLARRGVQSFSFGDGIQTFRFGDARNPTLAALASYSLMLRTQLPQALG